MPSFVDTNVLIYAEDRDAKGKHDVARALIVDLWESREGVVSVQVLQEFYVNVTKKLKKPLSVGKAKEIIEEYLTWTVVDDTGRMVLDAIDLQRKKPLTGLAPGEARGLAGAARADRRGRLSGQASATQAAARMRARLGFDEARQFRQRLARNELVGTLQWGVAEELPWPIFRLAPTSSANLPTTAFALCGRWQRFY